LGEGSKFVDGDRDALKKILKRNTDYDFDWKKQKINMWVTLCGQIGLVTETNAGRIVLSPCRALMHDALTLAPIKSNDTPTYKNAAIEDGEARHMLDWINNNMFTVYDSQGGTPVMHPAIADVLRNMENAGVISLSAPGDAQRQVELPPENLEEDSIGNRRDVTNISIEPCPDESAYEYPLNQFITHQ
jgi:hypothetical protein